ncbi:MCE family protein [Gordonia sp. (in: high G+C Gram-positive bacteria)]|uniref:MCE family protein n=1 Tax=Gordonia sp. (in: high G+C Gram-positive bacteria) TaxID=84139 RepID=UPI0016A777ED|nr:MCE family protein [Gordonia sp. (in: high G+C Gram-positive bacteria)]NLG48065.1 mammalian cell entry protein [Gordonia sp. (in: high G+C Gram-positive bacteria)]
MTARRGRVAATAAAVMLSTALTGCSYGLQDLPVGGGSGGIDVTADFAVADGVVAGADVRSGQQVIGRVVDIAIAESSLVADSGSTNPGARLTLALDRDIDLPANVTAALEVPSALGTPFIRLERPEHPVGTLTDGSRIGVDRSSIGPQVEGTLAALGTVVSGSGFGQLQSIVTSLNEAFATRSDKVGDLIDTLNRLLSKSSPYTRDFNRAMSAAARVSDVFAANQEKVAAFLDQTPRAVAVLSGQRDRIAALMTQTTGLAKNLDAITRGRQQQLNQLVPDAKKLVDALGSFNDDVGQTLTQMNAFMTNFSSAVRGDYLTFDGALDVPGSIDKILTGGMLASGQPLPTPGELADVLTGGLAGGQKKTPKKEGRG